MDALLASIDTEKPLPGNIVPISPEEMIQKQFGHLFCTKLPARLNCGEDLPFEVDSARDIIRKVERRPQIVVPHSLRTRILHLSHYAKVGTHPGGRKLHITHRRNFYWPAMADDCYAALRFCTECSKTRVILRKHSKKMKLFPARALLEFVAIDIIGPLLKTQRGNQFLLFITDLFSKLVRTVPLWIISAFAVT